MEVDIAGLEIVADDAHQRQRASDADQPLPLCNSTDDNSEG